MKSPLLAEELVHSSRLCLANVNPYQIFVNALDRASLIHMTVFGCRRGEKKPNKQLDG